ncbi:hypothetical protein GT347_13320 [Xylophilus rhododendri]|uniref:Uncharacterized protein n=1 Tax=Xylophilus rhododendri TaxID=2697032 RepID=A0A857J4J8_9BURK|nr:hypothetical protein [Xylophilus rhododendri]QHI98884.1 hypothetical protein GT347_13320 [Xylophilus rhododendri]
MNFFPSTAFPLARTAAFERSAAQVVPMYTPLWYATKVMATSANSWWEGGVPPARKRRQRAADAMAHAAAGMARRLHVVRHGD